MGVSVTHFLLLSLIAVFHLAFSSPLPLASPSALQAVAFDDAVDFPVNVVFISGPAQFGMWVPLDGQFHATHDLTCLNMPAYSWGACDIPTVDLIGVVAGNGPCNFVGQAGFWDTIQGTAGEGYQSVGPPQQITWVACG